MFANILTTRAGIVSRHVDCDTLRLRSVQMRDTVIIINNSTVSFSFSNCLIDFGN